MRLPMLVIALAGAMLARSAGAVTNTQNPMHDTQPFPRVNAVIDSTYRGHARVVDVRFFEGFSPGGSRDIPGDQIRAASDALDAIPRNQQGVLIGATDPQRFHDTRRKVTHMFNYALGLTRANYINQLTGNRSVVSTTVILNDRRGVYLVTIESTDHEGEKMIAAGGPTEGGPYAPLNHTHPSELMLDAHVSGFYLKVGHMDYGGPQVGLSVRKNRYELFTEYGRTFGDPDDNRIQTAGLRVGEPVGFFWQIEAIDARKLVTWLDMYTSRAVGGTGGVGFAWNPQHFYLNVNGGIGGFDIVVPQHVKDRWQFGFNLGATAGFTF